jgi:predicted dehydrogenase
VDAIVVATPDHWHVLAAVWACEAGKDVYVEKPLSHNVAEGQAAVAAARKYDRIVQVGMQRRSADFLQGAIECVRSGVLGKIGMARVWYVSNRGDIGREQDAPAPEGVNYDLWLGPAPKRPFNPNRFHYQWHWNWDYGTGELGNNGIHGLDMVRALLDLDLPNRITSTGGMFHFDDDHQTPDTQIVTWEYPGLALLGEIRMWGGQRLEGSTFGAALYGDQGTLVTDGGGWELRRGDDVEKHGGEDGLDNHLADFIECIKTRAIPNAEVSEGHKSAVLCHAGNIAHRLGRDLLFDSEGQVFVDDAEANEMLGRKQRPPFALPSGLLAETDPSGEKD